MCCPGAPTGSINFGLYQRLREMDLLQKATEMETTPQPSDAENNLREVLKESKKTGNHVHKVAEAVGIYPC